MHAFQFHIPLDTHELDMAGVTSFLPPVAEWQHAAHLQRQHVQHVYAA